MPGTSIEELLAHASWARRLAAALVADPHQADDLVQETWVAAMRQPPSGSGSTKAWIGRVMRNLASNRRRESARRVDREASVARPEMHPSSEGVAQELEMHRALVDALATIDADQARTIVRRYFHGLTSAEIAREERVPESTVRNRLMRGLEALRAKLDSKYGSRNAWMALLLPLTRKASPVVASASVGAGMVLLGKLAVAGLVVGVGSFALWRSNRSTEVVPSSSNSGQPSTVVLQSSAPVDGRAAVAPSKENSVAESGVAVAARTAEGEEDSSWLEARVLDAAGSPIEGAELLVIDRLQEIDTSAAPRATSGADGRVGLRVRKSDRSPRRGVADRNRPTLQVRFSAQACESVELHHAITLGGTSSIGDITLRPGGIVRGRVVCADPLPAKTWVDFVTPELSLEERASLRFGLADRKRVGYAMLRADGSYESSGLPVGTYRAFVSMRVPGHFSACSDPVDVRAGETTPIPDLALEQNPNTIQGRLVGSDGQPPGFRDIEFTFVSSTSASSSERLAVGTGVDQETGRFVIDLPRAGICDLFARDFGKEDGEALLRNVPTGTKDLVLKLEPPEFIELLVRDELGAPIQSYKVARSLDELGLGESEGGSHPEGRSRVFVHAIPFHLTVSADGFASQTFGPFDLAHFPIDLSVTLLPAPVLRGRVTDHGSPVGRARVWLKRLAPADKLVACNGFPSRFDDEFPNEKSTDEQGRFAFSPEGSGPFAIVVDSWKHRAAESRVFDCPPGVEIPKFELRIQAESTLEGHVLVADGISAAGTIVGISRGDGLTRTIVAGEDGRYRFDDLAPGPWWIRRCETDYSSTGGSSCGQVEGFDPSLQHVEVIEGSITSFDLDLRDVSCELRGRLRSALASTSHWIARFGAAPEKAPPEVYSTLAADGTFAIRPPVLGPHTLLLTDEGRADRDQRIEARLEIHRGLNEWSVELPTGAIEGVGYPGAVLAHRWKDDRGTTCTSHFLVDARGSFRVEGIPAGAGTIECDGRSIPVEVREGETTRVSLR